MAQRLVTVDDLDGTMGADTITFSVGKDTWEIDLIEENAQKLRDALEPFITKARKAPKAKAATPRRRNRTTRSTGVNAEIREWAAANGHSVPARGRVPQAVLDAYNSREK